MYVYVVSTIKGDLYQNAMLCEHGMDEHAFQHYTIGEHFYVFVRRVYMNFIVFLNCVQNFSSLVFVLAHSGLAVTKTHNRMNSSTLHNL